jgi:protein MAK11
VKYVISIPPMFTVQDTMLRIWRCHDWECVHVLSGHKEAITSVSIHPSGKLALSVSKDNTMKLWNLVQGTALITSLAICQSMCISIVISMVGRCSFTRRLRGAADKVVWHPSGDYYMLTIQTEVQVTFSVANDFPHSRCSLDEL